MLHEQGDKISGSERGDVENAIADARKALDSNDKQQMDQARERLTQASHKLAEQMYKAAQPQSGPGPRPAASAGASATSDGQANKDEGVVDAEYVDIDERRSA
jgi:molecular chaperone DnaK